MILNSIFIFDNYNKFFIILSEYFLPSESTYFWNTKIKITLYIRNISNIFNINKLYILNFTTLQDILTYFRRKRKFVSLH